MAINVADVLRFPDIVLGKEVAIEGWKPFLTGLNYFDTLISDNPLLMPDDDPIKIITEQGLRSPAPSAIEPCKIQISGTIVNIDIKKRAIEITEVTKIVSEVKSHRIREYDFPQGLEQNSIQFRTELFKIEDILPRTNLFMGSRIRIAGVILKTDAGFTITHRDHIIGRIGWNIRLNYPEEEVEKAIAKYELELPEEYSHSILINATMNIEDNIAARRGPLTIVEDVEIIGRVMPTDKPYFPAQMDDAVLIHKPQYTNKIIVADLY